MIRVALLALCLSSTSFAVAQPYPSRPVRVVVPFGPGNSVEVVMRLVTPKLSAALGQPFVIETVPGAAGAIGTERVARSAADGYTLLAPNDAVMTVLPSFQAKLSYDPIRDFVPVVQMAGIPFALVAHPGAGLNSVAQVVEAAKASPGKLNYSSGGNGSAQHLVMEMFMAATGAKMTHIPYKGAPAAAMDVVAGQIPVTFAGVPIVAEHIKEGRLRGLAVASGQRLAALPQVPTLKEQGVDLRFATWTGLFAPAGTPKEIVARLSDETVRALRSPDVAERLAGLGFEIYAVPSEPFATILRADMARMAEVVARSGIRAE